LSNSKRSKNALSHGLYASDVVLAWENEQDFKDLHEAFRDEFGPEGASEEGAVFDLACLHWKKRRLNIASQLAFHRQPDAGALADAGNGGWKGVAMYLESTSVDGDRLVNAFRAMAKSYASTVQKVHALIDEQTDLMSSRGASAVPAGQEGKQADPAEFQRLISMAKELNVMNTELIVPVLQLMENYDLDQKVCERAYRPEIMERHLKIEADIDKRIEKALARLVAIKEYKKFYGTKEVKAAPTEVINLPAKRIPQSGKA
jgi:hypothetical protein